MLSILNLTLLAQPAIDETLLGSAFCHHFSGFITKCGILEELKVDGPYTIFAPNDDALLKLPRGTIYAMSNPENEEEMAKLREFVGKYIVKGTYDIAKLKTVKELTTINNFKIVVLPGFRDTKVNGILLEHKDIKSKGALIHTVGTIFP